MDDDKQLMQAAQRAAAVTAQPQLALAQALTSAPKYAGRILTARSGWEVRDIVRELHEEIATQKATIATADETQPLTQVSE